MESNQTAARAARRFLDDRIRTDWAYPNVPPEWSASDEEVRDAQEFRERYYGDSESGDSNNGMEEEEAGPYKFDSPDSIGNAVAQTRDARRRRRRERLEAEMQENPGLRLWVERRDRWTGAASVSKYGTRRRRRAPTMPTTNTAPIVGGQASEQTTPSGSDRPSSDSVLPADTDTFDVVPVAPRLLDDNPIRASITPKAYTDIYQKIVTSSRTPSVPINLGDMTKALVQGWKDSDEWPPRPAMPDPLAGKKRSISGVTANGHHGFMDRHPHLEKSVDSVKRILHLDGAHHGPEHPEGGKAS
jgi:hypothetical protein